ncbi:MAG TPA: immunoglobulin domain-containing protein [Clostridia bacterium]|nr:immunoglobulin domain-containing protein [Clostridia bacterium]
MGNRANFGGGITDGNVTNSIIYFNTAQSPSSANHDAITGTYSCSSPLPSGPGNISADPLLLPGGLFLANSSPCRFAGTNLATGVDLFGWTWSNRPSMGCAEWRSSPTVTAPSIGFVTGPVGFKLSSVVGGVEPITYQWYKNGVPLPEDDHYTGTATSNLVVKGIQDSDAGNYQLVAANSYGMSTSTAFQVTAHFVNPGATASTAPFLSWETGATNIQHAIDAAAPGALVLVTNGIYDRGIKAFMPNLTNRVVIDKPVLVHAVNGPDLTTILGSWQPTSNHAAAVRCCLLTDGAMLSGFTVRGGATRTGQSEAESSGGGIYGTTNSIVAECVLVDNMAYQRGGGALKATLVDCTLLRNRTTSMTMGGGGGAYGSTLRNCILLENSAQYGGAAWKCDLKNSFLKGNYSTNSGAIHQGTLVNCTVIGNEGLGVSEAALTNCIVANNGRRRNPLVLGEYSNCTMAYSCATPLPPGPGNIAADPRLLADSTHLAVDSPCRGTGTGAVVSGVDLDGQPWDEAPSMGCDEWHAELAFTTPLKTEIVRNLFALAITATSYSGQGVFSWYRDGQLLKNGLRYSGAESDRLIIVNVGPEDAGDYWVVGANAFGDATSAVARVVIHCVDVAGPAPVPPYSSWATAATTIQDAIDISSPGDFVLVRDGVYSVGGKIVKGDLLNRVAITLPVTVAGINGPGSTIIQGEQDPVSGTGPAAVRCAWLADGAILNGFTLQGGATREGGYNSESALGGGVYSFSALSLISDCVIQGNMARADGGGCYLGQLDRCVVRDNRAGGSGGGLAYSAACNSLIVSNSATSWSGGGSMVTLVNCTVVCNAGGGVFGGHILNSIVLFNSNPSGSTRQYTSAEAFYTCTDPGGIHGNINVDPQLLDLYHLSATSPCRGAGVALLGSWADLDGEAWVNPPSIGCDEFIEANIRGPLTVELDSSKPVATEDRWKQLWARITGRAARLEWSFGDGSVFTNASLFSVIHTWADPGNYDVTFTAFNADHPDGVSTKLGIQVLPFEAPQLSLASATGTALSLDLFGLPGVIYHLQQTTNLTPPIVWTTAASYYGENRVERFTDTEISNSPARFYRIVLP